MGLRLRLPTPSDFLKHIYFIEASGIVAGLGLVILILLAIFYTDFKDIFDYDIFHKYINVKVLVILGLLVSCIVISLFIVELIIVLLPKCKACTVNGNYILAMIILEYIFILFGFCVGISMIVCAKHYNFSSYDGQQLSALQSLLNVGTFKVTAWAISLIIFIVVTVVFARMFQCE